jgi:hypothetical protein
MNIIEHMWDQFDGLVHAHNPLPHNKGGDVGCSLGGMGQFPTGSFGQALKQYALLC